MSSENKDKILSVVGKNYDSLTQIDNKVIYIAVGENHFIYQNSKSQFFGIGSNKFGQLGIKSNQNFYKSPTRIFQNLQIKNFFCGAEHTFIINQKNQVFSCGLNIKGQLGHGTFENQLQPKLVLSLLPFGQKNPKTLNPSISKNQSSLLIQTLQKYDLQVKMQDQPLQKKFVLQKSQYIIQISCGALFTLALSSQGNLYCCGYLGLKSFNSHDDQLQKSKFHRIQVAQKIYRISCGTSGCIAISKDNKFYIFGRFGKIHINQPKKISPSLISNQIGDQFAVFLSNKGEIYTFGENFDQQLGIDQGEINFRDRIQKLANLPLVGEVFVGRNTVFCVTLEKNQLLSWGSNKYSQLCKSKTFQRTSLPSSTNIRLEQGDVIVPSSYCTFFLSKKGIQIQKSKSKKPVSIQKQQQMIGVREYINLLQQYRQLKQLNLELLQKIQPQTKKTSQQSQTYSNLQLQGVTQYRKFNSNIQIKWSQIQLESQINQGGFGLIFKAKWREINVVVKKFKIQNGDVSLRDFLSQCHAMEAVRHPHIVMFLGAVTLQPHYSIILQNCSKGSLWSYIQNTDNTITWEQRRRFAMQIAQGVLYLHLCSPPILHRDLKSLNIFLDGNLTIKIGDFGWTKALQNYMTNKIGTYQWMAPEVIGNKPYTQKADVFSFSIILWQIASRQPPYKNISGTKVSQDVLHRELRPTIPKKTPQSWIKLMKRCWDKDPSKRPDFKEIVKELQVMKL